NQTGKVATWVLPAAHYLEAWCDARSATGVYSVVQPMIQPLFDGASEIDFLLALLGRKRLGGEAAKTEAASSSAVPVVAAVDPAYEAVKASFSQIAGGWDEEKWNVTLRDGFLARSSYAKASTSLSAPSLASLVGRITKSVAPTSTAVEVVLTPDASVWDGRYIDNPWLQEAPDPITKLTWDNAAWLSVRTFRALGLKNDGDTITVTVGDKKLTLPAIACPGHAHDSVTIPLGYGQKITSAVGKERGFDANDLRVNSDDFVLAGAALANAGDHYALAITQENYTMEARAQVREGTLERFTKDEDFAATEGMDSHIPPNLSLYKGRINRKTAENPTGFDYENEHQWGMVIDLAKCIGCSACIVACQSENNIAIVGKEQVAKGRVMQWIRMDRYFATSDDVASDPSIEELDNPEMIHQPVACQQCEAAPCETVCPVNATVHTEDGLNAMAYNRCIGTRYCANNCPFTARRFNFFDYNKRNPLVETKVAGVKVNNLYAGPLGELKPQEVVGLQKNPNVTVRMRGVIEKCTYCVQRLEDAKIKQRRVARDDASKLRVPVNSVKTACQASCPAEAIEFGDLANTDAHNAVNLWKANPRNYTVLKYLGINPRTTYLARIRNVNPQMPDDRKVKTGEASLHNI
ncbi:MAG: 4Fe-4S dicluster domain-containing protein, partial [Roseimicrobium sp.]